VLTPRSAQTEFLENPIAVRRGEAVR